MKLCQIKEFNEVPGSQQEKDGDISHTLSLVINQDLLQHSYDQEWQKYKLRLTVPPASFCVKPHLHTYELLRLFSYYTQCIRKLSPELSKKCLLWSYVIFHLFHLSLRDRRKKESSAFSYLKYIKCLIALKLPTLPLIILRQPHLTTKLNHREPSWHNSTFSTSCEISKFGFSIALRFFEGKVIEMNGGSHHFFPCL